MSFLRLSLIIPVYNVEQWVGRCLESCLNQDITKDDYEIIVVNDGSPDCSVERVQEVQTAQIVQEGKTNIRIIDRENGGLSVARNTGLKEANGEYVWFVDSDDWIEPNVLRNLLEEINKHHLDVLGFNLYRSYPDGKKDNYPISFEEDRRVYRGEEFICKVGMPPAAWAAIYRRDFIIKNNLLFMEGILHEDQEFTPRAYYLAERIEYTNQWIYNYFQREGSIMKSRNTEKKCKDLLTVADSLFEFMQKNINHESNAYCVFQDKINFAFSQSLAYYNREITPLSVYKNKPYFPLTGKLNRKYRLMNISLRLYLLIYKIAKR